MTGNTVQAVCTIVGWWLVLMGGYTWLHATITPYPIATTPLIEPITYITGGFITLLAGFGLIGVAIFILPHLKNSKPQVVENCSTEER